MKKKAKKGIKKRKKKIKSETGSQKERLTERKNKKRKTSLTTLSAVSMRVYESWPHLLIYSSVKGGRFDQPGDMGRVGTAIPDA